MKYRAFALILSIVMILSAFVSCSDPDRPSVPTDEPGGGTETTPPTETEGKPVEKNEVVIELPEKAPRKAAWAFYGCFGSRTYETEDPGLIGELMSALRDLVVSDEIGQDITTADTIIYLYMEDGAEYRIIFNGSSYEINDGKNYPYSLYVVSEGWAELNAVLEKFAPADSE